MPDEEVVLEPQVDADVSSDVEKRFGKSVNTAEEPATEPVEVETKTEEVVEEPKNEVDPSPAEVEALEEKADSTDDSEAVKSRIDKLTENWRTEQRQGLEKDKKIEELQKELRDAPKPPDKTLEDFEFDEDKYRAYVLDESRQAAADAAIEVATEVAKPVDNNYSKFLDRESKFETTVKDYRETVAPEKWPCSEVMASELHQSEMGPELAYHLAKNVDIAMDISRLPERDAVRRMTELQGSLVAEKQKLAKPVSKAPPPPPTIKASGDAGLEKGYREDMSDAEFNKMRRKEIANR